MARAGFSLVEMMLVLVVLTVAVSMLSGMVATTSAMVPLQLQQALASEAARAQVELMRTASFEDLFSTYNQNPADDPLGPGTANGANFFVRGLSAAIDDVDGLCGRVRFPEINGQLREDITDRKLGMPRDLNFDGVIGTKNVAADAIVLPVEIRIEWQYGVTLRSYSLYTMFVRG
jgi:prepilin-type N-terminal cleavage/methylation domain-containing protein